MALYARMQDVQRLLGDMKQQIINQADIIAYINRARHWVAGEGECVKVMGTLAISQNVQVYPFSSIVLSATPNAVGPFNVNAIWIVVAGGQVWLRPRSFPWFSLYHLNSVVPPTGQPDVWAQFAQGEAGSIYFAPLPDQSYSAICECVCDVTDLAQNTDADPLPQPWQDAVTYYAAYLAYLEAQRPQEAERMLQLFEQFMARARKVSTPAVLAGQYAQTPNITRPNQLGQVPRRGTLPPVQ